MRNIIAVIPCGMVVCAILFFAEPACAYTVSSGAAAVMNNNSLSAPMVISKEINIIGSLVLPEYLDLPEIKLDVAEVVNRAKALKDIRRLI